MQLEDEVVISGVELLWINYMNWNVCVAQDTGGSHIVILVCF